MPWISFTIYDNVNICILTSHSEKKKTRKKDRWTKRKKELSSKTADDANHLK